HAIQSPIARAISSRPIRPSVLGPPSRAHSTRLSLVIGRRKTKQRARGLLSRRRRSGPRSWFAHRPLLLSAAGKDHVWIQVTASGGVAQASRACATRHADAANS